MCERARRPLFADVVTAVGAVGSAVVSKAGRVGLAVGALGVAAWFWPLVVGVGGGVLVSVALVGYVLGASRERPLWVTRHHNADPTPEPAQVATGERARVAALEREVLEVLEVRAIAQAAVTELNAARERDGTSVPLTSGRVLPGSAARDEEG